MRLAKQFQIMFDENCAEPLTDLAGDGDGLPQPVGPQLQSDLLPDVVEDSRLLRRHDHVQEDVRDPGRGHGEVHPALVEALVTGADVIQHQAAGVVIPAEKGAALGQVGHDIRLIIYRLSLVTSEMSESYLEHSVI